MVANCTSGTERRLWAPAITRDHRCVRFSHSKALGQVRIARYQAAIP
jgi:hypothetical protein